MTFKPSVHGWPFGNDFRVDGPTLGLGTAPAEGFGLGGGMCWAALDRYLDGRRMPTGPRLPEPGDPLHAEFLRRQVAALGGVWHRVRKWQALPDGSWRDRLPIRFTPGRRDVASLTRAEWRRLRRDLDRGHPVLLTVLEHADGYARATAARQVLAYGYVRAGHKVTVAVYDPARPRDNDVRFAFSLAGPLDGRFGGGRRVRAFFPVPYDRAPLEPVRAETFADRSVLGVNRKITGSPCPAATRRALHLVARDGDRALIHFSRANGRHWVGANITEREGFGTHELYCDPTAIAGPGALTLHVFSRNYVGDLLHFRLGRRWRAANRTDNRRTGPRFRLDGAPVPVALPRGGVGVVGRGKDGLLITYFALPFKGWRADEVHPAGGARIDGDPAAVRLDDMVHVVARSRDGHLLHFERTRGGWSAGDLTATAANGAVARLSGPPVLIVHEGRLHVLGRGTDGELVHVDRDAEGRWTAGVLDAEIASDPAVTSGPAGVHGFAVNGPGGLVHAWLGVEGWQVEEVAESRGSAVSPTARAARLAAWGSASQLRVLGRRGGELVQWVWSADADWVAGPVSDRAGIAPAHQPGEDPVLGSDRAGRFHVFATDGAGTVVHLEPGRWGAPGRVGALKARQTASKPTAQAAPAAARVRKADSRSAGTQSAPAPRRPARDPEGEVERLPLLEEVGSEPALLPPLDQPAAAGAADLVPLLPEREIEADADLLPLLDVPEPASEAAGSGAAGSEAPASKPGSVPEAAAPEPGLLDLPALEPEPAPPAAAAPEPAPPPAAAPEPPEDEPFEWELPAEAEAEEAESGETPAPATSAGADIEPIDLETLENWPPLKPTRPTRPVKSTKRLPKNWPE